jgi:DNA/RNA-binding domain of Phe-tRNA-synthetase-like protein
MYFQHSSDIWRDFPDLVPGVLVAGGIHRDVDVSDQVTRFNDIAAKRLEAGSEGGLPEIQAWRRTFSKMGLKPTQYRCASESLLRRFRKEGSLPQIHPMIDLCNAVSLAFAIPVAVFDISQVAGGVEVRYASGDERYLTFAGDTEHPEPHEVIFADEAGQAHARRWTNRQSGASAVRDTTADVLIVAEALHETAAADVQRLIATLAEAVGLTWGGSPVPTVLSPDSPRFEF